MGYLFTTSASTTTVGYFTTSASTSTVWSWSQIFNHLPPLDWYIPDRLEATPETLYIHGRFGGKLKQSPFVSKIKPTGKGVTYRRISRTSPRGFESERLR